MPSDEGDYPDDVELSWPEPVGSCEWCGTNLYPNDDLDLCDQCLWASKQNTGDDDRPGIQPVM